MTEDKKMYFIQNMEDIKKCDKESHDFEYEVIVDTHIVGELEYGPYKFTIWEFGYKQEGEERKLCLRIREQKKMFLNMMKQKEMHFIMAVELQMN